MSRSISLAALAISALLSSSVVACADTDQPDKYEAFGGSGSGSTTSTSDLTSSTTASADEKTTDATPKSAEEQDKEDREALTNHSSKSKDLGAKEQLKGD